MIKDLAAELNLSEGQIAQMRMRSNQELPLSRDAVRADIKKLLSNFDEFNEASQYYNDIMDQLQDLEFDTPLDQQDLKHEALLKEASLAKRHLNIQFKLDGIRNKGPKPELFDQLEISIQHLSNIEPNNNFRDSIKSICIDEARSLNFGSAVDLQNQLIRLHNIAPQEQVYGESLYIQLQELKAQKIISEEDVEKFFILSLEWPLDI